MVMKLRRRKLSLRKTEWVILEEGVKIPVRTLSIAEEARMKLESNIKIPSKIQALSEDEKNTIIEQDPNYNPKTYIAVKVYDKTSPAFIANEEKKKSYEPMMEALKLIDFERKIYDEETDREIPYHEYLGVSYPINWIEVCEYFEEQGFTENHAERMIVAVNALKGDSIFQRIHKLREITGMEYIDLMVALEEVMDKRNLEQEESAESLISKIEEIQASLTEDTSSTPDSESKLSIVKNGKSDETDLDEGTSEGE